MLGLTPRTVRSGAAALAAALLLGGCAATPDPSVLATVDGTEITADAVAERLDGGTVQDYVWTDSAGPGQLARDAVDEAVRDTALAAAARDEGLEGSSQSELLSKLLVRERAEHPELEAASVTENEARAWFEEHSADFAHVERAEVVWIAVDDAGTARRAYEAWLDDPSTDPGSLGLGDDDAWGEAVVGHDAEIHVMVERIVNAVRTEGGTGLDLDADTGRWWLVRVDSLEFDEPAWDEVLSGRVRTAVAFERETEHLASLAAAACDNRCAELHEEHIDRFAAAREAAYLARDDQEAAETA